MDNNQKAEKIETQLLLNGLPFPAEITSRAARSLWKEPDNLPAIQYNTPVTIQADTCFCIMANVPTPAAAARSIRLTMKQDAAEFCIPVEENGKKKDL